MIQVKLIKKTSGKGRVIGHSTPLEGIFVEDKFFAYNSILKVGKDISKQFYESNKDQFRVINNE